MSGKIEISREQVQRALDAIEQVGRRYEFIDFAFVRTVKAEMIKILASPVVERQPVDAILLENCEEVTIQDYGRGYFATDDCVTQLYTSPPAPVAVALPERVEPWAGMNARDLDSMKTWNACLDKVKEMNQ